MWRDKVYSGTLRPQICMKNVSGIELDVLLNEFTRTIRSNPSTRISHVHSVDKIDYGLYLGDKYAAKDKRFLMKNGFTHVLNAAQGIDECQVNTDNNYYAGTNIKYLGIPGHDRPSWNISVYFEQASKFIHNAVINGGM
ncbi:dual specificity phosphatase DUPD1 [Agrilus planipennis]|uniref:Dual specificity protein phosphatase n=1 Tax=Agrilus planipennis TaxID=224129 RepID=A0A7F5RI76_AGRPL|nr:dual specificity phosphatase DUPD1 [Agrilus planipennis]